MKNVIGEKYSSVINFSKISSLIYDEILTDKVIKNRFQHRLFSMKLAKFSRTSILKKICKGLLMRRSQKSQVFSGLLMENIEGY